MKHVVYILGAGFSAPLGVPVISNFREKAQYLWHENRDKEEFAIIERVHKLFDDYDTIQKYYPIRAHDIEEMLSIAETFDLLDSTVNYSADIRDYIALVIRNYTPDLASWEALKKLRNSHREFYIRFFATIMGYANQEGSIDARFLSQQLEPAEYNYTIVTLNYDLIVENMIGLIQSRVPASSQRKVEQIDLTPEYFSDHSTDTIGVLKLHGSIDKDNIIPPTWNKSLDDNIRPIWSSAFQAIRNADHIRFVGYSLPETDVYMRYLIKSAATKSQRLSRISVICKDDSTGSIRQRYNAFISFHRYKFFSRDYLEVLGDCNTTRCSVNEFEKKYEDEFNRAEIE